MGCFLPLMLGDLWRFLLAELSLTMQSNVVQYKIDYFKTERLAYECTFGPKVDREPFWTYLKFTKRATRHAARGWRFFCRLRNMFHSTMQYDSIQYNTTLYNTVQSSPVQSNPVQSSPVQPTKTGTGPGSQNGAKSTKHK